MTMDSLRNNRIKFVLWTCLLFTNCEISTPQGNSEKAPLEKSDRAENLTQKNSERFLQYPIIQKSSINIKGLPLGSNVNSLVKLCGTPISDSSFSDPLWFDRIIVYSDFRVYSLNNNIVGFQLGNHKTSIDMIKAIGISDSILSFIHDQSKLTPQKIRVQYVPVYQGTQQLDEGLDFEFYEDGRVLIGYSSK